MNFSRNGVLKGVLHIFLNAVDPFDRLVKFMDPVVDYILQKWPQPHFGSHLFL